jgi:ribosomal protein S18 acetylase RimI-like enzyme
MSRLSFSHAGHADVTALVELVQSAYRGDASRAGWTSEADLLDGQRVDEPMLRDTLDRPDTTVLVVHDGDELVGCCELQRPNDDGVAHLGMFAVQPGRQGGGLGRAVLGEAERVVRDEWHGTSLELEVVDVRESLMAWYERRGYVRTGRFEPFPYGDERFGVPRRDDLRFEVLAKDLTAG